MLRIRCDRQGLVALAVLAAVPGPANAGGIGRAAVQEPGRIVSSEISISRAAAELRLDLQDGRTLALALRNGQVEVDGENVGSYRRGEDLDRSWRELLNRAMESGGDELATLLIAWESPDGPGSRLDSALEAAIAGAAPAVTARGLGAQAQDTLERLHQRIMELENRLRGATGAESADIRREIERELRNRVRIELRDELRDELRGELRDELRQTARGGGALLRPLRHVGRGIAGILSLLATYAVLVGLGFAAVFFGRRYVEGVADTARHVTLRSGLVGVAASFLVLPAFILGIIALAISIVGIPLLLVWIPLFPVTVVVAAIFGYLGVAHAAGESLAERRLYGGDWFRRGNSYYYVLTGLGLLMALFLASHVVEMAGPWLGFVHGMLMFLGVVVTWAAFSIGLGAVLLSRGGTRPVTDGATADASGTRDIFEEEPHV